MTISELNLRMMALTQRVERAVKSQFDVKWWKPSKEDELRLLRLEQWEQKYKVSMEWMLGVLVPVWLNKFGKFKKGQSLGVSISTLVGQASERILRIELDKLYPEREHIQIWRAREQQRQWLQVEEDLWGREDWTVPKEMVRRYRRKMGRARERLRRFSQSQKRPYRGNPWK
jgi:hypothetical protein